MSSHSRNSRNNTPIVILLTDRPTNKEIIATESISSFAKKGDNEGTNKDGSCG